MNSIQDTLKELIERAERTAICLTVDGMAGAATRYANMGEIIRDGLNRIDALSEPVASGISAVNATAWFDVDSECVARIGYNFATNVLSVTFAKSGHTWEYEYVAQSLLVEFLESDSKGTFYNTYIKGLYDGIRV